MGNLGFMGAEIKKIISKQNKISSTLFKIIAVRLKIIFTPAKLGADTSHEVSALFVFSVCKSNYCMRIQKQWLSLTYRKSNVFYNNPVKLHQLM